MRLLSRLAHGCSRWAWGPGQISEAWLWPQRSGFSKRLSTQLSFFLNYFFPLSNFLPKLLSLFFPTSHLLFFHVFFLFFLFYYVLTFFPFFSALLSRHPFAPWSPGPRKPLQPVTWSQYLSFSLTGHIWFSKVGLPWADSYKRGACKATVWSPKETRGSYF